MLRDAPNCPVLDRPLQTIPDW